MKIKMIKKNEGASALSEGGLNAYTFAEPSFDAVTYGLEEISKNDSGEIEVVDSIDSDGSAQALADAVDALHKRHPEKKYHIIAIGTDSDGIADRSEVIWSDYPEEVSVDESTEEKPITSPRWCVEFGDIYSNVKKEYYGTEAEAKARYDELAERGDIEWVEDPVMEAAAKEETSSYDDYAESVKAILMGREFEYGPETANEFVVDDYKDIVRKNFDAGKNAFAAAADIDDAYMGKE